MVQFRWDQSGEHMSMLDYICIYKNYYDSIYWLLGDHGEFKIKFRSTKEIDGDWYICTSIIRIYNLLEKKKKKKKEKENFQIIIKMFIFFLYLLLTYNRHTYVLNMYMYKYRHTREYVHTQYVCMYSRRNRVFSPPSPLNTQITKQKQER